jgi:hypothetical protein
VSQDYDMAMIPARAAELCRDRWHAMAGTIPDEALSLIERGEHFFAVLLLLEALTSGRLVKWRATFSSTGGAYECRFWVKEPTGLVRQFCGQDETSLTLSLVAALDRFRTADTYGPA